MLFEPSAKTASYLFAFAALLLAALATDLASASYPDRTIRIVVPLAPGGGTDLISRTLAQEMAKDLGASVIVENKPGAGTIIGSQAVATSEPDGYTLLMGTFANAVNPSLNVKLPYDPHKDFAPVALIARSFNIVVVNSNSAIKSIGDLIAAAKAEPNKLSYGTYGNGTSAHLAGELLNFMAKVKILAIPYKGGAPALTAVLAGEIPMSINPLPEVVGQLDGGAVRALAVTTASRSKALPDVPTVAESGVAGYDASVWWGFLGPAGMAPDLVEKIHADLATALRDPVVLAALEKMGATAVGSSPKEFDAYMRAEAAKWEPVLKEANIKMQ